jgi:hypothetical protein
MGGIEILALLVGAVVGTIVVFWLQENRKRGLRQAIDAAARDKEVPAQLNVLPKTQIETQIEIQPSTTLEDKGLSPEIVQTPPAITTTSAEPPRPPEEPAAAINLPTEPLVDISELSSPSRAQVTDLPLPKADLPEQPEEPLEELNPVTQIFDEPPLDLLTPPIPVQTTQSPRQSLSNKIATWGQLANPQYIPQLLQYTNHPSPSVREGVAKALGQIATARDIHTYLPQVISILDSLSHDRHLETRYQAIVTLGQIKSDRAIPTLTAALHNPCSKLAKAASAALERLKYYAPPAETQLLELPARIVYKKPVR